MYSLCNKPVIMLAAQLMLLLFQYFRKKNQKENGPCTTIKTLSKTPKINLISDPISDSLRYTGSSRNALHQVFKEWRCRH